MSDFLKPNYLAKKGGQYRVIRLIEVVTLLHNVLEGARNADSVGFEDAHHTIESLTRKLNRKLLIEPSVLESCLWSCNLLNERGEFWDGKGRTFEQFLAHIITPGDRFDRRYNVIVKKGDE